MGELKTTAAFLGIMVCR